MVKAVILTSGGLDSMLVIKLMEQTNIPYQVVHFDIGLTYDKPIVAGQRISKYFGLEELIKNRIEIEKFDIAKEFYSTILNIKDFTISNPCLEYKVFLLKKAKQYMQKIGAEFIVTGDVLDQRPMIQGEKALEYMDQHADVKDIVFRPLSALLLNNKKIVEKFTELKKISFDFVSFTDRRYALAKELKLDYTKKDSYVPIEKTELNMGRKAFEIFEKQKNYHISHLNRVGQHFKLGNEARLVIGRTPFESNYLKYFYYQLNKRYLAFSCSDPRFSFGIIYNSVNLPQEESLALQIFSKLVAKNKDRVLVNIYDEMNQLLGIKNIPVSNINIDQFILHTNDIFCPIIPLNINNIK